ncbi:MAG TPA: hypothetical protein VK870_11025, partial [Ignavibacteriaceae bacterium]|nr:hypothetical protein [Ignavibacteriaceae bacterium]
MKSFFLLFSAFLLIVLSGKGFSQSKDDFFLMPDGLGFSNQLEYSYDIKDKKPTFENWFNLDYRKGIFS